MPKFFYSCKLILKKHVRDIAWGSDLDQCKKRMILYIFKLSQLGSGRSHLYLSNRALFCVGILSSKHEGGWENSRPLCKPEM